jgi:DNA topoisomerase-2
MLIYLFVSFHKLVVPSTNINHCYDDGMHTFVTMIAVSRCSHQNVTLLLQGGRHVDYVTDMLVKQLSEVIKKKNKGGIGVKPFQIRNHMWVFVNCLIVNPTFDSQTKENMTLQAKSFGSKCQLPEKFVNAVSIKYAFFVIKSCFNLT